MIGRLTLPVHSAASRTCAITSSSGTAAATFTRGSTPTRSRVTNDTSASGSAPGRIVRRDRVAAAVVHQEPRRIELRHVGGELRDRQREVRGDAHERAHAHDFAVAGRAWWSRCGSPGARRWFRRSAGSLSLLRGHGGDALVAGQRAAQRRLDPLGQRREIGLAVERDKDGAAHQRGAAQAGQDRAGEPLDGDAAAVDQAGRRAIDQQWRFVAEIDRLCGCSQTIWIAPSALIQAPCPLRSPPRMMRGGPTPSPQGSSQRHATSTMPRQLPARQRDCAELPLIRTVTTGLSPMRTTREECGASAARGPAQRRRRGRVAPPPSTARTCGEICELSVLTRLRAGPLYSPHNGAPPAFGAMARLRSSSLIV